MPLGSRNQPTTGTSLYQEIVRTRSLTDRVRWLTPSIILLITCIAFLPALRNQFVGWDDDQSLFNNPAYRGLAWNQLRWMFTTFHMGHYQPLSWVTLGLDYLIWGMDPVGYHFTNIIFHAVNTVSFYFISRQLLAFALPRLSKKQASRLNVSAAFAALLFATHPLRVESVAWATERRDVLSAMFFFWTIGLYLSAASASPGPFRRRRLGAALLLYCCSLLSKASAITLPVILVILDFYPLRRIPIPAEWFAPKVRAVWLEKVPFLAPSIVFGVVALFAQHSVGTLKPIGQYGLSWRIGQAFYGIMFYLWKTILPADLSPLYELPYDPHSLLLIFALCAAAVLAISVAFFIIAGRWPALLACWVYYIVMLAPVLGIAQSGHQLVADRYSYLACLSWPLLVAAFYLKRTGIGISTAALGLITTLTFLSWRQIGVWHDSLTLWQYVTAVSPGSSIAQYNLGKTFESKGDLRKGLELYSRAVTLNPTNAQAQYNLARLLAGLGKVEEAIGHYRLVLAINPNDADAHNNLGSLLAFQGKTKASLEELQKAIEIDPSYGRAYFNIGRILARHGALDDAVTNFRHALTINPNEAEIHFDLGSVLAQQGQLDAAAASFSKAVELNPRSSDAHLGLARSFAALGKKEEAEREYQKAADLLKSEEWNRKSPDPWKSK